MSRPTLRSSPSGHKAGWPRPLDNPVADDAELAKKLWEASEKMLKDADPSVKGCL